MVGHRYTQEEREFLNSFIPGHTYKEIVAAWNAKFDEPITESRVKGYMGNHKMNNGLTGRFQKGHTPHNKGMHSPTVGRMAQTQFKKGQQPHNAKPIGYERISKDGYIEVKVRMQRSAPGKNDFFIGKHRLIWEEAHGPIPKGHKVIFLDGDKRNFALENLALVSNAENLQMTRKGLRSENPQFTETGILIAKTCLAANNAKKRKKNALKKEGGHAVKELHDKGAGVTDRR